MKVIISLYTLPLLLLLLCRGGVHAETCNNTVCGANDQCCDEVGGAKCYNPDVNSCLVNERQENVLCGYIGGSWFPASVCGNACYDEYEYNCCNGELYSRFASKLNPCLTQPGSYQPGCERCDDSLSCCEDINNGAQCYSPGAFLCVNDSVLCAIQEGAPNLACGSTCYDSQASTCCNGILYSKNDRTHPCAPQTANATIQAEWDARVDLVSSGFSSPGGTACGWNAQITPSETGVYELHNCTQWRGAGGFHFDETSYLITYNLPVNAAAYSRYEIDIFVDNSQGGAQTAAISVLDQFLPRSYNITNTTLYTHPCNTQKLFAPPIYDITLDIEAGFNGYKTIDVNTLFTWAFVNSPVNSIQLLISSFGQCSCFETNCCYDGVCAPDACSCESPKYRFSLGAIQSQNPPRLFLSA